jgi:hypothetical protein
MIIWHIFALTNTISPFPYSNSSTTHVYRVVCQAGSFKRFVRCLVLVSRHKLFCKWFLWFELKASSLFRSQPVCRLSIMWHLWCSPRPNSSFPKCTPFVFVHYLLLLMLMCAMNIHTFHSVAASATKTNNRQLIAMPTEREASLHKLVAHIMNLSGVLWPARWPHTLNARDSSYTHIISLMLLLCT